MDISRPFFREVSANPRVSTLRAAARWGVVQLVGHLTVNAHEGVAHETAGFGNDTQTPMFMRFSNRLTLRTGGHLAASFIKLN